MDTWLIVAIIVMVIVFLIGNFSTFQKNAKTPLRKKALNDLEETLPRSHKKPHQLNSRGDHTKS